MLSRLLSILITLGVLALIIWVVDTYFPALPKIWKALILASLVIAVIGLLHSWVCGWLCT